MVLLIDNYDSFSYNLYQLIGAIRSDIQVVRNDVCTVDEIAAMRPEAIFISPGPGRPEDAGICVEMIRKLSGYEAGGNSADVEGTVNIAVNGDGNAAVNGAVDGAVNRGVNGEVNPRKPVGIPMFGVCLGHQAICQAFGATVTYAKELMHGKKSELLIEPDSVLFQGLHSGMTAARYHSLSVKEDTLPAALRVTARTPDGEVMAVEHQDYPVYGVQFHPESVMTPQGLQVVRNFVNQIPTSVK
ncbi:MAG: aminodeoxychorismate/anthranilate synthase component II [Lachnospiraceae bacterium]|nr:aminodeoxychorismate/anthranilate synthase component II [Lachnospiraceae bacterium]